MKRGPVPDIFAYLSYRKYLDDWFHARKEADTRYSHRLFARRAGVRSPSLLKEVVAGRRNLSPVAVDGFLAALALPDEEAQFFRHLVQLEQARNEAEKNQAWEYIASSVRFRSARRIEGAMFRYLSTWYFPAIRELALCDSFVGEPAWIADQLLPKITEEEARVALDTLIELGMLVRNGDSLQPAEVSVATPHEVAGLAVHNYHRQMLKRAAECIELVDPDERHLTAVTVAIPRSLVPTLKAELDAMQERLLHLCDERAEDAERVYQVNLQLVPLSGGTEENRS